MRSIGVGLLGLGNVGTAVYGLLESRASRPGFDLEIRRILVRDESRVRSVDVPKELLTEKQSDILSDDRIDIVVELMGGVSPAAQLAAAALDAGKHVVTANKEVIAVEGADLSQRAVNSGSGLAFEAAVGGGIPIVRPLIECLSANRITRVMGIVNGTTNYILTRMSEGNSFEEALDEAKERGYAEPDPSADLSGRDAAAKIAILASIAFETSVTPDQVSTEGIADVTLEDIMYSAELGYAIKLIALAKEVSGEVDVRVHPTMIPLGHPLADVGDAYNAIFVEGDAVGELMFFGQGAGAMPTASAVVGDVLDLADLMTAGYDFKASGRLFVGDRPVRSAERIESCYYVLLLAQDRPGVLAKISKAFGDHGVSIGSVLQKSSDGSVAEVVFMTHGTNEGNLRQALAEIEALDVIRSVKNVIRVEAGEI